MPGPAASPPGAADPPPEPCPDQSLPALLVAFTLVLAVVVGTAVFRQISEQRPDRPEVDGVDLGPPVAAATEEPALLEFLEMERAGWRGQVALPGDGARRKSLGTVADQQPENIETALLGKCAEHLQSVAGGVGDSRFHSSNSIEINRGSQPPNFR